MSTKEMNVSILVELPPDRVWNALTRQDELTKWLGRDVEIDCRVGGSLELLSGTPHSSGRHKIVRVEEGHSLGIEWVIEGCTTHVTWSVAPYQGGTAVTFGHRFPPETPFETDDDFGGSCAVFEELWAYVGGLLKTYLELGEAKCRLDPKRAPAKEVRHVMRIEAPPERVFEALNDPEQVKGWNGFAPAPKSDRKVGGEYSFGWSSEKKGTDGPDKIVEYEEGRKITYSWFGEQRTLVSWIVEPIPGAESATRVEFVHSGFLKDQNLLVGWNLGWAGFLQCLALYLERGTNPSWLGLKLDEATS